MRSGRNFRLTREAEDDIRDILQFTQSRWGVAQRNQYRSLLTKGLKHLARYPNLGRTRDDLEIGLRSHPVERHLVFYATSDNGITIRRILHGARDVEDQLERS